MNPPVPIKKPFPEVFPTSNPIIDETSVVLRGLVSIEQAETFKNKKEYKEMELGIVPDTCNYFGSRYMLVRVDGIIETTKHRSNPFGWSEHMPYGYEITEALKGAYWDYCSWDSDKDKKILTFFSETKQIAQYFKESKQFKILNAVN